jgi:hypothetical protein
VFRYYAGSEGKSGVRLRFVKTLVKPGEQFRLPSGFRCDFIQFELEGQLLIHNMQIATSARELREV